MDGTFYLGDELIDGALDFINILEEKNKKYVFLTNNSSKDSGDYRDKLQNLGLEDLEVNDIINSGEVTANYIKKQNNQADVYVVGTPSLKREFSNLNINTVDESYSKPDYIVVGFDTTLNYKKLWHAHDLILEGTTYLATNPDYVCPLDRGKTMPDCGSIIQLLKTSTGKTPQKIIGKPNTLMIDYAASIKNTTREKMAIIGDRLYTDIQTAHNANISGILVLSGETNQEDIADSRQSPEHTFKSIKELCDLI